MISVRISYEKYNELHKLVQHPSLGTEIGAFDKMFKCSGCGPITTLRAGITLLFDNEEDAIWFRLKYL